MRQLRQVRQVWMRRAKVFWHRTAAGDNLLCDIFRNILLVCVVEHVFILSCHLSIVLLVLVRINGLLKFFIFGSKMNLIIGIFVRISFKDDSFSYKMNGFVETSL